MAKKYPENINDLENFYQKEFSDFSAEPSSELWNKIQKTLPKGNIKPSGNFMRNNYRWIGGVFFSGVAVLVVVYFFKKQNDVNLFPNEIKIKKINPVRVDSIKEKTVLPEVKTEETKAGTTEKRKKNNLNPPLIFDPSGSKVAIEKEESNIIVPQEIINVEEPVKIKEETETKKPQSFYEKYSKLKKDSVGELFVPEKK